MSAHARFATRPPGRLEWHPAHGDLGAGDPEAFHLHVEFVHAHGLPKGQFTTFSTCNPTEPVADPGAAVEPHST
jgi:hypothetical protein